MVLIKANAQKAQVLPLECRRGDLPGGGRTRTGVRARRLRLAALGGVSALESPSSAGRTAWVTRRPVLPRRRPLRPSRALWEDKLTSVLWLLSSPLNFPQVEKSEMKLGLKDLLINFTGIFSTVCIPRCTTLDLSMEWLSPVVIYFSDW